MRSTLNTHRSWVVSRIDGIWLTLAIEFPDVLPPPLTALTGKGRDGCRPAELAGSGFEATWNTTGGARRIPGDKPWVPDRKLGSETRGRIHVTRSCDRQHLPLFVAVSTGRTLLLLREIRRIRLLFYAAVQTGFAIVLC